MLKRYVGPYPEVSVSVAGNDFGTVKNGEALVIPDELAESVGWSEHWEDVKATKKNLKDAKETNVGTVNTVNNDTAESGTASENESDSNTVNAGSNENIADGSENEEGN